MINGYGLCLNEWLEDEKIKTELRLLIKISSLTAEKGYCYASNSYFSEYFKASDVTISKQIKKLEKLNYIEIEYQRRGAEIVKREIRLKKTLTDDYQKLKPTIKENFKDNNTSINNTSIIKEKDKKETLRSYIDDALLPDLNLQAFDEWIEYKKYAYKKASITKIVNMLTRYSYQEQQKIIDRSIMNNYTGLVEPKTNRNTPKTNNRNNFNDLVDNYFSKPYDGDMEDCEVI